ncbi:MAG: hypothetical protein COB53_02200 [Elusimicrobia bacterium]|nr:MAG: hypothetical protein COB53_02200 [Elusimicrobiota bacterium]
MKGVLFESAILGAADQMALDEAIFEGAEPDTCYLRFFHWPGSGHGDAVTFGVSMVYAKVEAAVAAHGFPLNAPLIRRATGGGIVYHDGDLTFSFVFPWSRLSSPGIIYKNLHLAAHLGLRSRGFETRLWAPPSAVEQVPGINTECFSGPEPKDLILPDGSKVLGGALRRRGETGLYQGSMRPEPFHAEKSILKDALVEGIGLQWKVLFESQELPGEALAAAERLRHTKYAVDRWNKRR